MRNVAQRDIAKPTLEACRLLEELKKGQAYAILHCTCWPGFWGTESRVTTRWDRPCARVSRSRC